jgi:DNA-binding LacI/PurR family transcriptional regulator
MPPTDEQAERFIKTQQSVILIDALHPKLPCIIVDDFEGGRMATEELIKNGHQKIAFVSDYLKTPFHPSMRYRFHGYRRALEDNNIPFRPEYQLQSDRGRTHAKEMARSLFSLADPPTAIFAASDTHAIGVLDYAADNQLRIPGDMSVIGFDGIRDSEYLNLTTIDQHLYESGLEGVNLLLQQLSNNGSTTTPIQIPLTLISRNTVAPPTDSQSAS